MSGRDRRRREIDSCSDSCSDIDTDCGSLDDDSDINSEPETSGDITYEESDVGNGADGNNNCVNGDQLPEHDEPKQSQKHKFNEVNSSRLNLQSKRDDSKQVAKGNDIQTIIRSRNTRPESDNPADVPREGNFFLHDERTDQRSNARSKARNKKLDSKKTNPVDDMVWLHDKYEEMIANEPLEPPPLRSQKNIVSKGKSGGGKQSSSRTRINRGDIPDLASGDISNLPSKVTAGKRQDKFIESPVRDSSRRGGPHTSSTLNEKERSTSLTEPKTSGRRKIETYGKQDARVTTTSVETTSNERPDQTTVPDKIYESVGGHSKTSHDKSSMERIDQRTESKAKEKEAAAAALSLRAKAQEFRPTWTPVPPSPVQFLGHANSATEVRLSRQPASSSASSEYNPYSSGGYPYHPAHPAVGSDQFGVPPPSLPIGGYSGSSLHELDMGMQHMGQRRGGPPLMPMMSDYWMKPMGGNSPSPMRSYGAAQAAAYGYDEQMMFSGQMGLDGSAIGSHHDESLPHGSHGGGGGMGAPWYPPYAPSQPPRGNPAAVPNGFHGSHFRHQQQLQQGGLDVNAREFAPGHEDMRRHR